MHHTAAGSRHTPTSSFHDNAIIGSSSYGRSPTTNNDATNLAMTPDRKKAEALSSSPNLVVARETSLPLIQSAGLAIAYMLLSIAFFLLIRYSKLLEKRSNHTYVYDNAAAVFLTELTKWLFSVGMMYYRTGKFLPTSVFREGTWRIGIYYAVPSLIYAVYNNLTYFNLTMFDPGTYQVFMQTRVLFTGVLYVYILQRPLTERKWAALLLLTLGVISKHWSGDLQVEWKVFFMLFQASLSAFAGVYNEFLLKRDITMDVNEQNFFMYSFAVIINLVIGLNGNPTYYLTGQVFSRVDGLLLLIVLCGASVGIVTSLILKFINVIVKAFASACEVLLTALFAYFLLSEPLSVKDFVASCIVMGAIYVYYTAPAAPTASVGGASSASSGSSDRQALSGGDGSVKGSERV